MKKLISSFWGWYERNYLLNISFATLLFSIQLVHLYWLSADVVATKLFSQSFFKLEGIWYLLILIVDYTEIPALITTSFIYLNELRKGYKISSLLYLFFLNSQWIHIFWITDEFVIEQFTKIDSQTILPLWLAWIAITIDYLELPVIFDTIKRLIQAIQQKDIKQMAKALKED